MRPGTDPLGTQDPPGPCGFASSPSVQLPVRALIAGIPAAILNGAGGVMSSPWVASW